MKNLDRETSDYDEGNYENKLAVTKVESIFSKEGADNYFTNQDGFENARSAVGSSNDLQPAGESTSFGANQTTTPTLPEENKSMSELKAQGKSLQLLYLKTRAELDKLKNKPQ